MTQTGQESRPFRRRAQPSVETLLKDLIVDRGYRPGDKLPTEVDFADELGVSRSAVREAMRSLQTLGILEIRHGHGIYLSAASLAKLSDGLSFWSRLLGTDSPSVIHLIAEVRQRLEVGLIADVVGKLTDDDFADLAAAVAEIDRRAQQGERALDADRRFHEVLYRPLDNWVLTGLLHAFWDSTKEAAADHAPDFPLTDIARDHQRVLDALVAQDVAAATQAMHAHFEPLVRASLPAADRPRDE